jgi:hypothetical protein
MRRYGIKGTVYVVTSMIGKSGYMSRDEIVQLSRDGWEIGSHSCSHVALSKCSPSYLTYELRHSRELLERLVFGGEAQHEVIGFAFPYGGNDSVGFREMQEAEKYYAYSLLSSNRPSRIAPHKREITVMVEPLTNLLYGRNPSLGGIADFKLNLEAAIVLKGWHIFYTDDISDFSVPSIKEFQSMARYAHDLSVNGTLSLKNPADVIKSFPISRVDFGPGLPEILLRDRNFQRWSQAVHGCKINRATDFVLKPLHLLTQLSTKCLIPVDDFGSWSTKNATFAMIQSKLLDILSTVRQPASILLLGSAAVIQQPNDYDILLITRFFPSSIKTIRSKLQSAFPQLDIDIGYYSTSRLGREVSIFLYEAKSVGVILSGDDVRENIKITAKELFPHEAIRLLLNRTFYVIRYMIKATEDPTSVDIALKKVKKAHIDATLLMEGIFSPNLEVRNMLYTEKGSIPILNDFEEARQLLKSDLDAVLHRANITSLEHWLLVCKTFFRYPLPNRIRNGLTGKPSFLFRSPSHDFFRLCNQFLMLDVDQVQAFVNTNFEDMLKLYKLGSQPVIPKVRHN